MPRQLLQIHIHFTKYFLPSPDSDMKIEKLKHIFTNVVQEYEMQK